MPPPHVQLLAKLRPEIEGHWMNLLRDEPALSPLGRPGTLVFLINATLTQLMAGFSITPEGKWLRACTPLIAPLHVHCACGLLPLRRYFNAGEAALRLAAAALPAGEIEELVGRYRLLARQEIAAVCLACHQPDTEGCEWREANPAGGCDSGASPPSGAG